ncbi:MAG: hypothetical protein CR984_01340 [Proteobacteria bacterium]|nr:MAG: hypothetical protein CR984_01340 [Pseudomonadota bacterium]PIE67462.1 MAG: hypothetical protein CSA23_04245 [Deltaproteobacteria bacterium]
MNQTICRTITVLFVVSVMLLNGCRGPEEKREKYFSKGQGLYEQGEYIRARLEFTNSIKADPEFARGYYMLGMAEFKLKHYRQAYGALLKAVELEPELMEAQLQLGQILRAARELDKAMEKADLVLAKTPDNSDALILKASLLMAKKDLSGAVTLLEGMLGHSQNPPAAYLLLASGHARRKDREKAEAVLKQGIAAHPDDIPLHMGVAQFLVDSRRLDEAEQMLIKITTMAPDKPAHKFNLARFYQVNGRFKEAEKIVDKIIRADPVDEATRLAAARFYAAAKDADRTAAVLQDGIAHLPESVALRLKLAEVYAADKKTEKAVAILKACLAKDDDPESPDILKVKNALAELYLAMRRTDEAIAYVDQVLEKKPGNIDARFTKGKISLANGDGETAVSEFRTVASERKEFIPAHLGLANAHLIRKEYALALDTLKSALAISPDNPVLQRALARVYANKKDYKQVETQLRKIVASHPKDVRARVELGDFLFVRNEPEKAETVYEETVREHPDNPLGYLRLSRLRQKQADESGALEALERGTAANPTSKPLVTALVKVCVAQKRYDRGLAACQGYIDSAGKDVLAYNLLGYLDIARKRYASAEKMLNHAVELQPLNPAVHNNLARLYMMQGKKAEAVANLEATIAKIPGSGAAYLTLGLIYQQDKAYEKAIAVYQQALANNPDFWFAANNLAFLMGETSTETADLEDALELANQALLKRPDDPSALDTVGWLYYRLGKYNKALLLIEQAAARAPDTVIIHSHLGMVLYKMGRIGEARENLKKALADDEDFIGRGDAEQVLRNLR